MTETLGTLAVQDATERTASAEAKETRRLAARRISPGRLQCDLVAASGAFLRGFSKDERASLRADAYVLIARWEFIGDVRQTTIQRADDMPTRARSVLEFIRWAPLDAVDLGGADNLPTCTTWLDFSGATDENGRRKMSAAGWRACRAALNQAKRSPLGRSALESATPTEEVGTEPDALGRLAEESAPIGASDVRTLPDLARAEVMAEALDLTLAEARALVYWSQGMSPADASALWGVSEGTATAKVSAGKAALRRRFTDPGELVDHIRGSMDAYRAMLAQAATIALIDWRDGYNDRGAAEHACTEWRSEVRALPMATAAMESAARLAIRRHHGINSEDRAERIASSVPRLMSAEVARFKLRPPSMAPMVGTFTSASVRELGRFVQSGDVGANGPQWAPTGETWHAPTDWHAPMTWGRPDRWVRTPSAPTAPSRPKFSIVPSGKPTDAAHAERLALSAERRATRRATERNAYLAAPATL